MTKKEAAKLDCPPLSQNDIIILRGKPVIKEVKTNGNLPETIEKWEYINGDSNLKESYFFCNNRLIGWAKAGGKTVD